MEINNLIEKNKEKCLGFLKELISQDTTNKEHGVFGNEMNAQRVMIDKLNSLGMEVDAFEPDNAELEKFPEVNHGHNYENRPNVVATLKGAGGGRSLIMNGHIDTMPFTNLDEWITHPTQPLERDGKLYGRGACDMKGGLAAAVCAMELIKEQGIKLKGDVILQSVVDEEGGGNGTVACIQRGYKADAAIIMEPTELEIMPAHMGWLFYKMSIEGKALHSAMKWKGVNAIEKMMKFMAALQELERNWCMNKRSCMLPPPTINFGIIEGGIAGSVVADECMLDFGLHYLPSDGGADGLGKDVEREVFETLDLVAAGDKWLSQHPYKINLYQNGSGYEIPRDHPLIAILEQNHSELCGGAAVVRGCEYGSDARLLTNYANTPTVLYGPGCIQQAHSVNEYIDIEEYYRSIEVYVKTIMDWCGVE